MDIAGGVQRHLERIIGPAEDAVVVFGHPGLLNLAGRGEGKLERAANNRKFRAAQRRPTDNVKKLALMAFSQGSIARSRQRSNVPVGVYEHARGRNFRADESEFARGGPVRKKAFAPAQQDRIDD